MFLIPFKYSKYIFSFDFFQKKQIYPFYEFLHNNTNNKQVINDDFNLENGIGDTIHEIKYILPSYFKLESNPLGSQYKLIKFHRIDNFRINLDGFKNVEDYLKSQMGSKSRSQLRRRIHGLETCFNIRYVTYYGDIYKTKI